MANPRYVVKRIGNDYRILRADSEGVALSALSVLGGTWLAFKGLRHPLSLIGWGITAVGGGLVYYGLTGKNPVHEIQNRFGNMNVPGQPQQDDYGPSHQHDQESPEHQQPEDAVDEASMESFPASDSPARSRSTGADDVVVPTTGGGLEVR